MDESLFLINKKRCSQQDQDPFWSLSFSLTHSFHDFHDAYLYFSLFFLQIYSFYIHFLYDCLFLCANHHYVGAFYLKTHNICRFFPHFCCKMCSLYLCCVCCYSFCAIFLVFRVYYVWEGGIIMIIFHLNVFSLFCVCVLPRFMLILLRDDSDFSFIFYHNVDHLNLF